MPDFQALSAEDNPQPTLLPVTTGKTFRPSVTESGIFDLDSDDKEQPRKTSSVVQNHVTIDETVSGRQDGDLVEETSSGQNEKVEKSERESEDKEKTDEKQEDNESEKEREGKNQQKGQETKGLTKGQETKNLETELDDDSPKEEQESKTAENLQDASKGSPEMNPSLVANSGEDSWADPGRAADLKMSAHIVDNRPPTATSVSTKFKIMSKSDILLEDTNFSDEDL